MNAKRATVAFLIAALAPGLIAIFASPLSSPPSNLKDAIVGLVVWYLFAVPIVVGVGFATLFAALKIKYGPIFLPILVGGIGGMIIPRIMFSQTNDHDSFLFATCGLTTAIIATLIYFKPKLGSKGRKGRKA